MYYNVQAQQAPSRLSRISPSLTSHVPVNRSSRVRSGPAGHIPPRSSGTVVCSHLEVEPLSSKDGTHGQFVQLFHATSLSNQDNTPVPRCTKMSERIKCSSVIMQKLTSNGFTLDMSVPGPKTINASVFCNRTFKVLSLYE